MEELLKLLAQAVKDEDRKVEVHKVSKDDIKDLIDHLSDQDEKEDEDFVSEAVEMAHLNRVMYDAHIGQGFTADEALQLTIAMIDRL